MCIRDSVYSARYAGDHGNDQANNDLLLKNMEGVTNRACRFLSPCLLYTSRCV